jgi:serine/threonine protein phosphatase PrpC
MPREDEIRVELASQSDCGSADESARDCLASLRTRNGDMIVVADGIGPGRCAGRAGKLVVDAILGFFRNWDGHQPRQMLIEAVGLANTTLREAAASDPELKGAGSTVAALHFFKGVARIAHVGNSRVYRVRGNVIDLMTNDHTEAQRLADNGQIEQEAVRRHPKAHVLYRAIGSEPVIDVDISDAHFVEPNESYILCTDGLTDVLADEDIGRAVITQKPQQACDALVRAVAQHGGRGSPSVAVLRFYQAPRETAPFTAGLAGPPAIERATPRRALPALDWSLISGWWKVRLVALGVLVLWFVALLLAWWIIGARPTPTVKSVALLPLLAPVWRGRRMFRREGGRR